MSTFNLEYRLTRADLNTYHAILMQRLDVESRNSNWWRSPVIGVIGTWILVAVLAKMIGIVTERMLDHPIDLISIAIGVGFAFILMFLWLRLRTLSLNSLMYRDDGPSLAPQTVVVDQAGLKMTTSHTQCEFSWPVFIDVAEYKGLIMVWIENIQAVVIPRTAFATEQAAKAFCAFVRDQIAANSGRSLTSHHTS